MKISSVLENALNAVFSTQGAWGGNFRSKLSREAYQDATNHVFESEKTIV